MAKETRGLPLEVFPQKVQEIIFNLAAYENFNIEYSASIVLSAVAAAIGNSCQIQIKGNWLTSPSIYMMLVGRPGLGKTPPLSFLYRPIREQDDRMFERYLQACDEYERAPAAAGKNGCFNVQTVEAVCGRDVILLPDLGATDAWLEKLPMLQSVCRSVTVSTLLEDMATNEQRSQGLDIADFLLAVPTRRQILRQMIARNPSIRQLIDELDLELIEDWGKVTLLRPEKTLQQKMNR